MKKHSREFKLASPAIDNTYSRFRDPSPMATLMLTDAGGVDWIVLVSGQKMLEKALSLRVGEVIELYGTFSEQEVITNHGRMIRRSGEAERMVGKRGFTKTKSRGRGFYRQKRKVNQNDRPGGSRGSVRLPKRQLGWFAA